MLAPHKTKAAVYPRLPISPSRLWQDVMPVAKGGDLPVCYLDVAHLRLLSHYSTPSAEKSGGSV
jgi:hypothetical protein